MTKRALILDFDGVIVDTEKLHFDCWNAAFDELLGLHVAGDHRQLVGLALEQIFDLWLGTATTALAPLTDEMRQRLLARKTELYFARGADVLTPMTGVVELLWRTRDAGWYITIASRARRIRLLRTLEMLALPPLFDLIMGTEDLVAPATDRKIHTRAAAPFGIQPAHCIVIEDSASGVRDAVDCGIGHVIGFTSTLDATNLLAAGAHEVVDSLNDVQLPK